MSELDRLARKHEKVLLKLAETERQLEALNSKYEPLVTENDELRERLSEATDSTVGDAAGAQRNGAKQMIGQAVLVTTAHRGVFYGQLVEERDGGKTIELTDARCAIRWGTSAGFLELAQKGPNSSSKIGAVAPRIRLHDVTSITLCSETAIAAWSRA